MEIVEATRQMILEEMEKSGADINTVSRRYGVPVRIIREVIGVPRAPAMHLELYGGYGRPELRNSLIARTLAGRAWASIDRLAISQERVRHDLGLTDMCQGRDGEWILLYSITRRVQDTKRTPYFSRDFGNE